MRPREQIDNGFGRSSELKVQAGKLRAIAVASPARTALLPDTPTFAESGMPGFEAVLHYGLLAPAGTPKPIVERLNAELRKLVGTEEVKARIHAEGGDPLTSSADEYARDIDAHVPYRDARRAARSKP